MHTVRPRITGVQRWQRGGKSWFCPGFRWMSRLSWGKWGRGKNLLHRGCCEQRQTPKISGCFFMETCFLGMVTDRQDQRPPRSYCCESWKEHPPGLLDSYKWLLQSSFMFKLSLKNAKWRMCGILPVRQEDQGRQEKQAEIGSLKRTQRWGWKTWVCWNIIETAAVNDTRCRFSVWHFIIIHWIILIYYV